VLGIIQPTWATILSTIILPMLAITLPFLQGFFSNTSRLSSANKSEAINPSLSVSSLLSSTIAQNGAMETLCPTHVQQLEQTSSLNKKEARDEAEFLFDVYISYVDQEPDSNWVWNTLVPRLKEANMRIAISNDMEEPGVARVVNIERGIKQARRTIVVLSPTYLADHMADFQNILGQTLGIQEGTYRLLPVKIAPIDARQLPMRLSMLTILDLTHPYRAEHELVRLVQALQGPLPLQ
jgi:hypothetical protein